MCVIVCLFLVSFQGHGQDFRHESAAQEGCGARLCVFLCLCVRVNLDHGCFTRWWADCNQACGSRDGRAEHSGANEPSFRCATVLRLPNQPKPLHGTLHFNSSHNEHTNTHNAHTHTRRPCPIVLAVTSSQRCVGAECRNAWHASTLPNLCWCVRCCQNYIMHTNHAHHTLTHRHCGIYTHNASHIATSNPRTFCLARTVTCCWLTSACRRRTLVSSLINTQHTTLTNTGHTHTYTQERTR